jgi:16S rRNA (adenine1518-N6/adenine1519-N6)-dimethyltransferase
MDYVRPKKFLGQHFLTDHNIAQKIVGYLDISETSNIVELGPGKGILTKYLLSNDKINLRLVEIDGESVRWLHQHYPSLQNKIIQADFLKLDFKKIFDEPFMLIGNFPYNISSQIFFRVLENKNRVPGVICMIQKEVSERIASKSGSKVYGILSVLLQTFYEVEYLFTVNEKVFDPPPKVKSAVIKLSRNSRESLNCDTNLYFKVVKTAFNQRRKMLRNSLKSLLPDVTEQEKMLQRRPEQLSVDEFLELTRYIEKNLPKNV